MDTLPINASHEESGEGDCEQDCEDVTDLCKNDAEEATTLMVFVKMFEKLIVSYNGKGRIYQISEPSPATCLDSSRSIGIYVCTSTIGIMSSTVEKKVCGIKVGLFIVNHGVRGSYLVT